jgi:hypothetical protein
LYRSSVDRVSGDDSKQLRNNGFPVFVKAKPKNRFENKSEKPVNRPIELKYWTFPEDKENL